MLFDNFLKDPRGKRYSDVINDPRFNFEAMVQFFDNQARQQRMIDAQPHFQVPPLGGVVKELEQDPAFAFLGNADKSQTRRLRQVIGVIVKVVMEQLGYKRAGKKGSLYSLSKYFKISELYTK